MKKKQHLECVCPSDDLFSHECKVHGPLLVLRSDFSARLTAIETRQDNLGNLYALIFFLLVAVVFYVAWRT